MERNTGKADVSLHDCDSLTSNGTWAVDVTTDAVNLTIDIAEKQEGTASLNFDIDVSETATDTAAIQNSTLTTSVDLSGHEDKSTLFVRTDLPDVTNITSVKLRWGSDTSNYWEQTAAIAYNGMDFKVKWNHVGFAWNGAEKTGSPDSSSIDFLRFEIVYSSGQVDDTDFRIDDIRSKMPERVILNYYSTNFVKTDDGAYQAEFSADDDTTVLEDHEDDMLLFLALEESFEVLRELDASAKARADFNELFVQITQDKPSEKEKPTDQYYYMLR